MQATAETAMGGGFRRNSDSELKLKNRCTGSTSVDIRVPLHLSIAIETPFNTCFRKYKGKLNIFTVRKRSLGQGNIFSSVCQEFCIRGLGVPGKLPPFGQVHPPGQVHTPSRYTPALGRNPPTPHELCMLGDTGNKQAVRILLECILVTIKS